MRQWLKLAVSLCEAAKSGSYVQQKNALQQIEGLNLFLKTKKAQPTAAHNSFLPPENIWLALRATKEKRALSRSVSENCPFLVQHS
jgi:hypothetical protein